MLLFYGVTGTLESGGTPVSVPEKDINFYDYDGTRLYSYTLAEVQNLTELPALPSHTGLTCQGWNWTLADIKAEGKETDVGAMYITDDGKTRLYIDIATEGRMTVPLCFRQSVANGVEVDWGDGSAVETFSGSGSNNILPSHTYSNLGEYVITLNPIKGKLTLGGTYNIFNDYDKRINSLRLLRVELGKNLNNNFLNSNCFSQCMSLKTITMPNYLVNIGQYTFSNCYSLNYITIPSAFTYLQQSAFVGCSCLNKISFPKTTISLNQSIFSGCYSLTKFKFPPGTAIPNSLLQSCISLTQLIIPSSVTSIGSQSFAYCYAMKYYDFSSHTAIPTLANTNAFNNIPSDCKIIVPDNLYDDWITATNWSTYASYIIKKSDWEASQV